MAGICRVDVELRSRSLPIRFSEIILNNSKKNAFFIEGGGTKGVYAIGILKYLFEDNMYVNLSKVDIFGGTSVGSYLAAALSLGYQKEDLIEIAKIVNIDRLIDSKYLFFITAFRFISKKYLYDDAGRIDIIRKILDLKIDQIKNDFGLSKESAFSAIDITFGNLKYLIDKHPTTYKHLLINVVDISQNNQIFMTTLDDKFDDIKIFDAMIASSALPFVFKPLTMHYCPIEEKYKYHKTEKSTINQLIDGGVSTNNPLDYFLLNNEKFSDYNLWLLKFRSDAGYAKIDGIVSLLKQLLEYLLSGKNDIKMDLIKEEYQISVINLYSKAGVLDIYETDKVIEIINDIYNQCTSGKLYFGN